jgi:hypothetical protein
VLADRIDFHGDPVHGQYEPAFDAYGNTVGAGRFTDPPDAVSGADA